MLRVAGHIRSRKKVAIADASNDHYHYKDRFPSFEERKSPPYHCDMKRTTLLARLGRVLLFRHYAVCPSSRPGRTFRSISDTLLVISVVLLHLLAPSPIHVYAQDVESIDVIEQNALFAETDTVPGKSAVEVEIGQLMIDNTFSKAGSDFRQIFHTLWTWPPQNAEQFIITISERPSLLNSTLIEITVNELKVFERFLQPRYDVLEELAAQAVDVTLQYILNYQDIVKQLGGEDLSGSGIY